MDKVALRTYLAMQNFLQDERGDVNVVSIVVLIGIAIALAMAFRTAIIGVLQDLFTDIRSSASSVANSASF